MLENETTFEAAGRTEDVGGFEVARGWIRRDRTRDSNMWEDGTEDALGEGGRG